MKDQLYAACRETCIPFEDPHKLKVKAWGREPIARGNKKRTGVPVLRSDKSQVRNRKGTPRRLSYKGLSSSVLVMIISIFIANVRATNPKASEGGNSLQGSNGRRPQHPLLVRDTYPDTELLRKHCDQMDLPDVHRTSGQHQQNTGFS